jgi:hypothetical protein
MKVTPQDLGVGQMKVELSIHELEVGDHLTERND